LKIPEKNIQKTLQYIGIDDIFVNRTPVAQQIRARIVKQDCIKLKSFYALKET
jgi:hypothetical protein